MIYCAYPNRYISILGSLTFRDGDLASSISILEHFEMATPRHGLYDITRKETKLFVNCNISQVISHQKLKNMEFRGKKFISDFLLNFANVKVIYFES